MQRNIFSPRVQGEGSDTLSVFFKKSAQAVLVLLFGFLPLVFIPGVFTSLGLMKTYVVAIGVYVALIFAALSILRSGKVNLYLPLPLVLFWAIVGAGLASALLSGDVHDALYGSGFGVQTVGFWVILALVMSISLVFTAAKTALCRLVIVMAGVSAIVYAYSLARLFAGPEFLSFGFFTNITTSLVGSLNDLAIYAGLVLLVLLVGIERVTASRSSQIGAALLTVSSLGILMIVNFSFVWFVVAFAGLLAFLYLLSKDTWLSAPNLAVEKTVSRVALGLVALVTLVSGAFIVSGDYLGSKVANLTGVSYLEVRPSVEATVAIARNVYSQDILFGVGPNRFEDAWRLFKDPVINQTQFWNTTFQSGSAFVATLFITTGFMGIILFLAFLGSVLYVCYRLLFKAVFPDNDWRLLSQLSVATVVYLWLMALVYVPGSYILLLTVIMTGILLAINASTLTTTRKVIDVMQSRQYGFILIACIVLVIVSTTAAFISLNKQFIAQSLFVSSGMAFAESGDLAAYDTALARVSSLDDKQDIYPAERARLRLGELNRLLSVTEPTAEEQAQFETALAEGVGLAEQAIALDKTNPFNYALLGSLYGVINESSLEGLRERREQAFTMAQNLDPQNPEYPALQAQLAARFGDIESARSYLTKSIALKNNYTDALFLSSQLDIQTGNATSAIATTRSIISIEPNNPARYFQLGLLEVAIGNLPAAIEAFEAAVFLDNNYANARYMLGLAYLDVGQAEAALTQLRAVQETNQDNQELANLISQIEGGDLSNPPLGFTVPVNDSSVSATQEDVTLSDEVPETSLLVPVNQPPRQPQETTSDTSQSSTDSNTGSSEAAVY